MTVLLVDALAGAGKRVDARDVRAIAAQYRAQAHLGDIVTPVIHEEQGTYCVSLEGDGRVFAVVRIEF